MSNKYNINFMKKGLLKRLQHKRSGNYVSLNRASAVGFIIDAENKGVGEAVGYLISELEKRSIKFKGFCINDSKRPIVHSSIISSPHITSLYRGNTFRNGIPFTHITDPFLKAKFDILIDLSWPVRSFTAEYILRSANASSAIGIEPYTEDKYDIIITQPEETEEISQIELIENIIRLLTTIN